MDKHTEITKEVCREAAITSLKAANTTGPMSAQWGIAAAVWVVAEILMRIQIDLQCIEMDIRNGPQ